MTVTEQYLTNNAQFATSFSGGLPLPPSKHIAVLACMDARLDIYRILGINPGEAHVIRNAGGIVSADALRSLAISQRVLGTKEIILIHHTDCGMLQFSADELISGITAEHGVSPDWSPGTFASLEDDVAQSLRTITATPYLAPTESLRGFIFDINSGLLQEVKIE